MRQVVISLCAAFLLAVTGCGGDSPEDLAKQFNEAVKAKKTDTIASIQEKAGKLSDSDKKKYLGLTIEAQLEAGLQQFGDIMKNVPKFDVPKFDVPKFDVPKFEVPKFDVPSK